MAEPDGDAAPAGAPAGTPVVRRRGKTLLDAIFAATLDQLRTVGYARLTMEGVAAAAGTGKAALYRRWRSREELVTAALSSVLPDPAEIELTGDPRKDLLAVYGCLRDGMHFSHDLAFQAAKREADLESGVAMMFGERVMQPVLERTLEVLRTGIDGGLLRPGCATEKIANVGPAMMMHHLLTASPEVTDPDLTSIVDDVMLPLIQRPGVDC
jgi:AcrR family transcriptional regulator